MVDKGIFTDDTRTRRVVRCFYERHREKIIIVEEVTKSSSCADTDSNQTQGTLSDLPHHADLIQTVLKESKE